MRFPFVGRQGSVLPVNECPWCGTKPAGEPPSFALLSGGAFLMDRTDQSGGPSDLMDAYLYILWHGTSGGDVQAEGDIHAVVPLVEGVRGGQFDVCFCSVDCLRAFLNRCVDELVTRVQSAHSTVASAEQSGQAREDADGPAA